MARARGSGSCRGARRVFPHTGLFKGKSGNPELWALTGPTSGGSKGVTAQSCQQCLVLMLKTVVIQTRGQAEGQTGLPGDSRNPEVTPYSLDLETRRVPGRSSNGGRVGVGMAGVHYYRTLTELHPHPQPGHRWDSGHNEGSARPQPVALTSQSGQEVRNHVPLVWIEGVSWG